MLFRHGFPALCGFVLAFIFANRLRLRLDEVRQKQRSGFPFLIASGGFFVAVVAVEIVFHAAQQLLNTGSSSYRGRSLPEHGATGDARRS